ncbi:hypothetical protein ACN28S_53775 [Cystobacter fuscus]
MWHLHAWRRRNVLSNPVCRKCRYATSCGEGCAVLAEGATGTLYKNFCDGYAQRFQAKVAQAYQEHVSGSGPGLAVSRLCETRAAPRWVTRPRSRRPLRIA